MKILITKILICFLFFPFLFNAQVTTHKAGAGTATQSVDINNEDWDIATPDVCISTNSQYARLVFNATVLTSSESLNGSNFSHADFPDAVPVSNASLNMAIENFTAATLLTNYFIQVLRTEGGSTTTMFSESGTINLTALSLINESFNDPNNWNYSSLDGANLDNSTYEVQVQFSYTAGAVIDIGIDQIELEFSTGTALPLTWISTSAEINNNLVNINWITADEDNVSHFEVYHSSDNSNWKPLGNLPTQLSNHDHKFYFFQDKFPGYGINYYRIKEVDHDGKFEYSKIVAVTYDGNNQSVQYRVNAANNNINLFSNEILVGKHNFSLYDYSGKLIHSWKNLDSPGYEFSFSIPTPLSGLYVFAIEQKELSFQQAIPVFFKEN